MLKSTKYLLFIVFLGLQLSCSSQEFSKRLLVKVPTVEQEASSIWRTINDIEFLEQQGYNINLPSSEMIDSLIQKSKAKEFGNNDFATIYNLLEAQIYDKSKYESAFAKVKEQEGLLNQLINQLSTTKDTWKWDFKDFESYDVVFTLYGTGGSYDPDLGLVTLFTNEEGAFMNYDDPANTIMHEIVHMGVEYSIIQKYNLPHGLKERIVDKITFLMFKDQLPKYKVQNMGEVKIDEYIKAESDLKELDTLVKKYLLEK